MWKLTMSLLFVVVLIMDIIRSLSAQIIILDSEKYHQDLSLHFEEPMDKCDETNYGPNTLKIVNESLEGIEYTYVRKKFVKLINLEDNHILSVSPDAFKGFKNLSCLNMGWNSAVHIFSNFLPMFNHTSLAKLNLAHATYLDEFGSYRDKHYKIFLRHVETYPNVSLPNCTHLDISGNNLIDLPMYFEFSFPNLTHLYISGNKFESLYLNQIPSSVKHLYLEDNSKSIDVGYIPKNLTELFLSYNYFDNVEEFKHFKKLKTLSCRYCEKVISVIHNLAKRKLVNLDISSNRLKSITDSTFVRFKGLKRFSLDKNQLTSLSFIKPLNSLTHFSAAYNKIRIILANYFESQVNLDTINLRGNNIIAINRYAFTSLDLLKKLDVAENKIMIFDSLWEKPLPKLEYLNFESNLFLKISDMYITNNSSIKDLFVANNTMTEIYVNNIKHLPTDIRIHVSLKSNCSLLNEFLQ